MHLPRLTCKNPIKMASVQLSHSVVSDSLRPHGLQHTRPPCPSPTPELTQTHVHESVTPPNHLILRESIARQVDKKSRGPQGRERGLGLSKWKLGVWNSQGGEKDKLFHSWVHSNSCPSSRWHHPAIVPFSSCPQSFPASGSFPMSQLLAWGGQSMGVSAWASVLPRNTQDWSPLAWTCRISLQSKGLSRVFSNSTVQKHQFFGTQLSSQSNSHIQTWPLEKP